MERGFVPDSSGFAGIFQIGWYRGEPKTVSGVKKALGMKEHRLEFNHEELVPITAHRCTGCCAVRLYAHKQEP